MRVVGNVRLKYPVLRISKGHWSTHVTVHDAGVIVPQTGKTRRTRVYDVIHHFASPVESIWIWYIALHHASSTVDRITLLFSAILIRIILIIKIF